MMAANSARCFWSALVRNFVAPAGFFPDWTGVVVCGVAPRSVVFCVDLAAIPRMASSRTGCVAIGFDFCGLDFCIEDIQRNIFRRLRFHK